MSWGKKYMVATGVALMLVSAGAGVVGSSHETSPATLAREAEAVSQGIRRMRRRPVPTDDTARREVVLAYVQHGEKRL